MPAQPPSDLDLVRLRRAVLASPRSLDAYLYLAIALRNRDRDDEAKHVLRTAIRRGLLDRPWPSSGTGRGVTFLYSAESLDVGFARQDRPAVDASFALISGHFRVDHLVNPRAIDGFDLFVAPEGEGPPRLPPNTRLLVNTIADPDTEPRALARTAALVAATGLPVVNDPNRVLETSRDRIARLCADLPGLVFPETLRVPGDARGAAAVRAAVGEGRLSFPVIVRRVGTHTGISMARVDGDGGLDEALASIGGDGEAYVSRFHDYRSADGWYRKFRLFGIDGGLLPEHLLISDHWNIHSAARTAAMATTPSMQEEERAFLADPASIVGPALAQLRTLQERLGLDYFGIDAAALPDGRLLVFEANPCMRINLDHVAAFPYLGPPIGRLVQAFDAMVQARLG